MSLLSQAIVLLASAVVVVPLLKRFGLASVLGFLAAGVVIGPWGLRLIEDPEQILHATEFGVVLLMFVIGLELQPSRLWILRRSVIGLGGSQVAATGVLLFGAAYWLGLSPAAAWVAACALSLSSTAFVLQMLAEKNQLATPHGRDGFAILLFQDLAVIPLMAALPWLAPIKTAATAPPAWLSLTVLFAVVVGGRVLLRPALSLVARAKNNDVFTMATLLVVTATAWGVEQAGLSMSLGAFLAGVLLADSEFRHEIEANIEPFKGVLLGLFFVAVGMAANVGLLLEQPLLLFGLACALMLVKAGVLFGLSRINGLNAQTGLRLAVYLCQGGEFAFVLLTIASSQRIMARETADLLSMTVTLSMALTPLMVAAYERFIAPRLEDASARAFDEIQDLGHPVIIAGFGRFGQIVSRMLRLRKIPFTVLEANADQVDFVRRYGNKVYYGDASRLDLLRAAGADKAVLFVLAIDDVEASIKTAQTVRRHFPHLKIYARARNRFHYYRLLDEGVTLAVRETFASSVDLGIGVFEGLGIAPDAARHAASLFVAHDEEMLTRQQAVHHDEAKLIQATKEAMKELEGLFESDRPADGS